MDYFPVFFDVCAEPVVVFGASEDALRKVRLLMRTSANIYVVSAGTPQWDAQTLSAISVRDPGDVDDVLSRAVFAIIAEEEDDARISALKLVKGYGLRVNVVDQKGLSDFIVPSLLDRGRFLVAFSTGGAAPVLARDLRAELERVLPEGVDAFLETSTGARAAMKIRYPGALERRHFWERAVNMFRSLGGRAGDVAAAFEHAFSEEYPANAIRNFCFIRVPDSGRTDELTLGQFRAMQSCDLALVGADVPTEILDLLRRDAARLVWRDDLSIEWDKSARIVCVGLSPASEVQLAELLQIRGYQEA